jgi:hypothetical protein
MRDSLVFYRSFYEAIKDLPQEERLKAYEYIFNYAFEDKEPEENGAARAIFKMAKPQIDANNQRYENGCKGAEYGKLGGRPRKEKPQENPKETPKKPQENPKETPNDNVNDNENVNDNVNDNDNDNVNVNDIIRSWNDLIGVGITPIKSIGHTRKSHLRARLREYGSESIYDIIDRIRESDFLQGKHKGKPWVCTFDWVILPNNYPKVLEGNYANKSVTKEDKISDIDEYIARRAGVIT